MTTSNERLKKLRETIRLTQAQLGEKIGLKGTQVRDMELGKVKVDSLISKILRYAVGVNSEWLLKGEGSMFLEPPTKGALPITLIKVLGRVPAGFPENVPEEDVREVISLSNVPEGCYSVIVHGESMGPDIRSGDYAIFVPADRSEVRPGDVVIANNEFGEPMIKRYVVKEGEPLLKSDNPGYPNFKPNEHYKIVGKVVRVWREIKI